jgi:hypothetical protein
MVGREALRWMVLCLQDMYFHAAAILSSLDDLGAALAGIQFDRSEWDEYLARFREAYHRTQDVNQILSGGGGNTVPQPPDEAGISGDAGTEPL